MDPRVLEVTQNAIFHSKNMPKQHLLVSFCYMPTGIEVSFWTDGRMEMEGPKEHTVMRVKISFTYVRLLNKHCIKWGHFEGANPILKILPAT